MKTTLKILRALGKGTLIVLGVTVMVVFALFGAAVGDEPVNGRA